VKGEIGAKSDRFGRGVAFVCPRLLFFVPLDLAALYVERLLPNIKNIKERAPCIRTALFLIVKRLGLPSGCLALRRRVLRGLVGANSCGDGLSLWLNLFFQRGDAGLGGAHHFGRDVGRRVIH